MKKIDKVIEAGNLHHWNFNTADRVVDVGGLAPTVMSHLALYEGHCIFILDETEDDKT